MNIRSSLMALAACAAGSAVAATTTSLNGLWKFAKEAKDAAFDASPAAFDDKAWQTVEVPHDWAISGPFDPEADGGTGKLPWRGTGWYRRTVTLSAADARAVKAGGALWLEFDGVMACPKVYVNGRLAGSWDYGYMGFRVDAAPFVTEGENVIAVHADTTHHQSRWYPGAGIYRSVRLVQAPAVHVAPGSVFVSTPAICRQSATTRVSFTLANRLPKPVVADADVLVRDAAGRTVLTLKAPARQIAARGETAVVLEGEVRNPALWDVADPQLHTAQVVVRADGRVDERTVRFGIRQIAFTADDGFHLNGRRVQIQGVDLHSDMGPLGMAFNRSVMRRQLEIMKDMGANALRTSHNACDPQVLDLCDEMGIVVWNECFDKWDGTAGIRPDQKLEEYVSRNLRAFAVRDRNHPSVVVWSIGNEIPPNGYGWQGKDPKMQNGMSAERFREFRAAIRAFDTTRPVGIGCCHCNAVETGMFAELDITGWNYGAQYRSVKKRHPEKPVLYSESASALSSNGAFEQPPAANKTDYDVAAREVGAYEHNAAPWSDIADVEFARMEEDRYCGGEFVWTGIDYLGEPTPYVRYSSFPMMAGLEKRELARSSYFGIADLMGLPKERYYLYRAHWNRQSPTLHISPHWNWTGRNVGKMPVYVYTDGDEAELFLNGRSLGRRVKGVVEKVRNLAEGKKASASSVERKENLTRAAAFALDGRNETRWCASSAAKGQWWQVDLGRKTPFESILVAGEQADSAYAWTVQLSDDAQTWRTWSRKGFADKQQTGKADAARFVRIVFDDLKPGSWASIRDVVVSDCADAFRLNPYYDVCARYRLRWFDVPYEPGELKAVAYKNGRTLGETAVRTAEKPVAVKLTAERAALPADGETCVFVQVDLVDAKGTRDPWASDRVKFALSGPGRILAVGNGDARAHDAFTDVSSHRLYFGKAVAVVRRDKGATGPIVLTASVDGLKDGQVEFK
ncbi:MAG: glycoside hydrolase family 2 TIM barrel-domain containing protein [Kiritimatiellia bacterium]